MQKSLYRCIRSIHLAKKNQKCLIQVGYYLHMCRIYPDLGKHYFTLPVRHINTFFKQIDFIDTWKEKRNESI